MTLILIIMESAEMHPSDLVWQRVIRLGFYLKNAVQILNGSKLVEIIATADGGEVNVVDSNVGENTDGGDKAGGDVVSVGEGGINGTDIGGDNITAQAGGGGGGGGAGAGGKAGASGGGGALGGQGGPAANTRPPIVTVCPPVCDVFVLNDENPCNYFLCSLDVHPTDCTDGRAKKTEFTCDEGTYFSEDLMYCDFICNAEEEIECPTTPRPYPCENYTIVVEGLSVVVVISVVVVCVVVVEGSLVVVSVGLVLYLLVVVEGLPEVVYVPSGQGMDTYGLPPKQSSKHMSAAPAFQQCMDRILDGLPGTTAYLDDILVAGRTRAEAKARLLEVLHRLHVHNVRINLKSPALIPYDPDKPIFIITDASPYVTSAVLYHLDEYNKERPGIRHILSPAYHAQSNGLAEKGRNTPSTATGVTPSQLFLKRRRNKTFVLPTPNHPQILPVPGTPVQNQNVVNNTPENQVVNNAVQPVSPPTPVSPLQPVQQQPIPVPVLRRSVRHRVVPRRLNL
ncbi:hypothetical protein B566_EDAN017042 [Ephemera danica]|nr:hypothetical protein B566_EDAN017042 [Ephemera danica]